MVSKWILSKMHRMINFNTIHYCSQHWCLNLIMGRSLLNIVPKKYYSFRTHKWLAVRTRNHFYTTNKNWFYYCGDGKTHVEGTLLEEMSLKLLGDKLLFSSILLTQFEPFYNKWPWEIILPIAYSVTMLKQVRIITTVSFL